MYPTLPPPPRGFDVFFLYADTEQGISLDFGFFPELGFLNFFFFGGVIDQPRRQDFGF